MKKTNDAFAEAVRKSRALSSEQKELLLEEPALPENFRQKIIRLLKRFDTHSKAREAYLRQQLDASLVAFSQKLDEEGVDGDTKRELLMKARAMNAQFFSV